MHRLFKKIVKFLAYTAAGVVILLAVAVGLFRLFLPKLPEYQDELKAWASDAIGMQVEFSGMDARWGLRGPELYFFDAELVRPNDGTRLLAADEVSVGVATLRLLRDQTLIVDSVGISGTSIEIRQFDDGSWALQGAPLDTLFEGNREAPEGSIELNGEDIELGIIRPGDERPVFITLTRLAVDRNTERVAADATVRLPDALGRQMVITATQLTNMPDRNGAFQNGAWDVDIEADELELAGWSQLVGGPMEAVRGGTASVDLSLRVGPAGIAQADVQFELENTAINQAVPIESKGRLGFRSDATGWLLALDEFELDSEAGSWPESSLLLQAARTSPEGSGAVEVRADYVNLADIAIVLPWLEPELRAQLVELNPRGVLRNARFAVADLAAPADEFVVTAEFEAAGWRSWRQIPGVTNLSGALRADESGGLLDIDSTAAALALSDYLSTPLPVDALSGTLIWRRSDARVTLLSDSIVLESPGLLLDSSLELSLDSATGPVVDLAARFDIDNIARVKRYIPDGLLHPKLYDWFQSALVSGRIDDGRAVLSGPLRSFPFDGDEGSFRIEATVRDTEFRYLPRWPAATMNDVDVVLDKLNLYTRRNRSTTVGNRIVDARVAIPDLREPVLTINGNASGTLDTLRQFTNDSPLAALFAGQLDTAELDGDASVALDLTVPLKRARDFEVTARVETGNGRLVIPGLNLPVTDIQGTVTIGKSSVSSDGLMGRFLGEPVTFSLARAPVDGYSIVLNSLGRITDAELVDDLGLPVRGLVEGAAEYSVSVLFPDAQAADDPRPLTVDVSSDLVGLALLLPEPFSKPADEPLAFAGDMRLLDQGQRIESRGGVDDDLRWRLAFLKADGAWDLDRGTLSLGPEPAEAPETRGLHIRGQASDVVFEDWLALGSGDNANTANTANTDVADRIRSIDVEVTNLRVLGQHLVDHRVRLDRSARDWLVQFEGADVQGSVFVPYEFNGDRPLVLDMERLVLPGDATAVRGERTAVDPRTLPAVTLRTAEFGLGDRFFGAVEAEFERTPMGLQSRQIVATDDSFDIVANASWLADGSDALGSKTRLGARLVSSDVAATLDRLGYSPGLVSEDMVAELDLVWSGGPGGDFLPTLDGQVDLRLGVGQLDEVEPGAGRVFGLMSIVALPRRLSLDFSDVFGDGFGFDKIEGSFRLDDGETYTCNLSLEAPAADIAIIGRASLVDSDYEQTALIGANVGNALPVVAAATAGPQAAVAVLIFSQIFKKPLQGLGQVYYSIDGSWSDPVLAPADAERFAQSSALAGCIDAGGPSEALDQ